MEGRDSGQIYEAAEDKCIGGWDGMREGYSKCGVWCCRAGMGGGLKVGSSIDGASGLINDDSGPE